VVIIASRCKSKEVESPRSFSLGLEKSSEFFFFFLEYSFVARRYGRCWDYRPFGATSIAVADAGRVTPLGEQ
jgi:hypothetical protein